MTDHKVNRRQLLKAQAAMVTAAAAGLPETADAQIVTCSRRKPANSTRPD